MSICADATPFGTYSQARDRGSPWCSHLDALDRAGRQPVLASDGVEEREAALSNNSNDVAVH